MQLYPRRICARSSSKTLPSIYRPAILVRVHIRPCGTAEHVATGQLGQSQMAARHVVISRTWMGHFHRTIARTQRDKGGRILRRAYPFPDGQVGGTIALVGKLNSLNPMRLSGQSFACVSPLSARSFIIRVHSRPTSYPQCIEYAHFPRYFHFGGRIYSLAFIPNR